MKTEMYPAPEYNENAYKVISVWSKDPSWFAKTFLKRKPESFRSELVYIYERYGVWYSFPKLKLLDIFSEPFGSSELRVLHEEMLMRQKIYNNELPQL